MRVENHRAWQPSRKFQIAIAHVVFQTCFRPSLEDNLEACLLWPAVACRGFGANCRVAIHKSALTLKPQWCHLVLCGKKSLELRSQNTMVQPVAPSTKTYWWRTSQPSMRIHSFDSTCWATHPIKTDWDGLSGVLNECFSSKALAQDIPVSPTSLSGTWWLGWPAC